MTDQKKKTKPKVKRRNLVARDMYLNPSFRPRIIASKKIYDRKRKEKEDPSI
ncbi:MAG: hypothetical protein LBU87_04170 [Lactobacillales bacterium]|jgi:hypothetical protein|nr:hypothetical protein [Lactobacillales bacterium]